MFMKNCRCNKLYVSLFIVCFVKFILFILIFLGIVCIDYEGFAVDKEDNLYIGMPSIINVYSPEGDILRSFSPKTSRGYSFTIEDGETVFIDSGDKQYTLDLYGVFLKTVTGNYPIVTDLDRFISESGNEYIVHNHMFRTTVSVVEDGFEHIVFKMPLRDYTVKLLDTISDFILFGLIAILVFKKRRLKNKGEE